VAAALAYPFVVRRLVVARASAARPSDWFRSESLALAELERQIAAFPSPQAVARPELHPNAVRRLHGIVRSEFRMAAEFWMWATTTQDPRLRAVLADASLREHQNCRAAEGPLLRLGQALDIDGRIGPNPAYGDSRLSDRDKAVTWNKYVSEMPGALDDLQRLIDEGAFDSATAGLMRTHIAREWETYNSVQRALEALDD
jgi:hypothetical protein